MRSKRDNKPLAVEEIHAAFYAGELATNPEALTDKLNELILEHNHLMARFTLLEDSIAGIGDRIDRIQTSSTPKAIAPRF